MVDYTLKSSSHSSGPQIDYQAELNKQQYAAVASKPGPILVIAGAGSGKTRTLTYRVAYLVEHGIRPERILLLTFTNKAAKEMLRRVSDVIPHDISRMWGGTFHHVGHRLLRRHAEEVGLERNFSIMDREDCKDFINASFAEADIDPKDKRFPKPDVLINIFGLASGTSAPIEKIIEQQYEYFLDLIEPIKHLAKVYADRKRRANAVDFDDLLSLTEKLLRKNEELRKRYQQQFQHILVDEYQDTNQVQSNIVDLIGGEHHQVMVVGDDAQSIYSWRGANFANIMKFPERHPNAKVIRIETNYRSSPEILSLANASIAQNENQFEKSLQAVKDPGVKPAVVGLDDSRQQSQFVAQRILELREEGVNLSDMAILYRSHFHSMEIQMELTSRNIPFQITSGIRFFEQAHIKDVSAFLKFAMNRRDEIAFKRVALMLPGIGARTAHKIWNAVSEGQEWETIKVPAKSKEGWLQWGHLHKDLAKNIQTLGPSLLIDLILEAYYSDYLKSKYPNYTSRAEDIGQLKAFAEGFTDCADFLGQLSLMTNLEAEAEANDDNDDESIRLTTIHQAKGLEWKVVFVIMLCDGLFPSSRSIESSEGEEEERRLFYVAVTRAQDELYLSYPRLRTSSGYGETWQQPSRFLSEFPRECANVWNVKAETDPGWEEESSHDEGWEEVDYEEESVDPTYDDDDEWKGNF